MKLPTIKILNQHHSQQPSDKFHSLNSCTPHTHHTPDKPNVIIMN